MRKGALGASEAALALSFDAGAAPQLCSVDGDSLGGPLSTVNFPMCLLQGSEKGLFFN